MRILIGAILGAIVLFAWGFVSWTVIGLHETNGGKLPNEAEVRKELRSAIPATAAPGIYWIPGPPEDMKDPAATDAWSALHEEGPVVFMAYSPAGSPVLSPVVLAKGFGVNFVSALIAAILLSAARIRGYLGRVLFVLLLGGFVAVTGELIYWNYMYFPTDWTAAMLADHLIGWGLVALVLGLVVRPKPVVE